MMRRFDNKGETIVETIAAMLLVSVSVVMLVTAIVSAARVNSAAQQRTVDLWGDESQSGEMADAELEASQVGSGTIKLTNQTYQGQGTLDVSYEGGEDVVSYSAGD